MNVSNKIRCYINFIHEKKCKIKANFIELKTKIVNSILYKKISKINDSILNVLFRSFTILIEAMLTGRKYMAFSFVFLLGLTVASPLLYAMESKDNWAVSFLNDTDKFILEDEFGNVLSEEMSGEEIYQAIQQIREAIEEQKNNSGISAFAMLTEGSATYLENNGYTIQVPFIRNTTTNRVTYCLNFDLEFPNMDEYYDSNDPFADVNMRGILYYGFDGVDNTLQSKYGLSDSEARYGTGIAIWKRAKELGIPGNSHNGFNNLTGNQAIVDYINELKAKSIESVDQDFSINFDGVVSQIDPQSTNPMSITIPLAYTVSADNGAYVTDLNGNRKNSFGVNEEFLIKANGSFIGQVNVTVSTYQETFGAIYYNAKLPSKQNVVGGGGIDPIQKDRHVSMQFEGALGKYSFQKLVNQNAVVPVTHDRTSVTFQVTRADTNYNVTHNVAMDGTTEVAEVLLGTYNYVETHWSETMQPTVKKTGTFEVVPSQHFIVQVDNDTSKGILPIEKEVINPTTDPGNKDYKITDNLDQIELNIADQEQHFNYNKNSFLNNLGKLNLYNMPIGTYNVKEVKVPKDLHINNTVFTAKVENETTATTKLTHIANTAKKARAEIGKKDTNTGWVPNVTFDVGSSLMKDTKGIPLVYTTNTEGKDILAPGQKVTADGKYYNLIDPTTKIDTVTTGEYGKALTKWFLFGYEQVYIQEIGVPGHIMLNKTPKLVSLKEEDTVYTEFLNVIDDCGVIQIPKRNEDGASVEWYFLIYRIEQDGTETYMETITTSKLNGIGNSTPLQLVRADNTNIDYKVCEKEHPLYKTQPCKILKRGDFNLKTNIAVLPITNYWKDIKFVLPKVAQANAYDITADGTEFKIWDKVTKEVLATGVTKNGLADFSTIKVPKVLDNKNLEYWETKVVNGLILDTTKYPIEPITEKFLATYTSGTPIYLKDKSDPLVNQLPIPKIGTTAMADGKKTIKPNQEKVILTDKVYYENLAIDKEHILKGLLMDKVTGKPLLIDGKEVRAEQKFTPKKSTGYVDVVFEFDTTGIDEQTDIVVYEYLEYNKKPITEHTDITDPGQTVTVEKPTLSTTAINLDGGKTVPVNTVVTIKDVVEYCGLTVGEEYTINGVLIDKTTGEPVKSQGEEVRATQTFIPTKSCDTVELEFIFDTTGLDGRELVVYEEVTRADKPVAEHKDINDKGQTIQVEMPQLPVTGEQEFTFVAILILLLGIILFLFRWLVLLDNEVR